MSDYKLIDNKIARRYEFHIGEYRPAIDYEKSDDNEILLTRTSVPAPLQGQGIGTKLVEKTLEHLKEKGMTVIPLCEFVLAYIQKHPEWYNIVGNY